VVETGRQGAPRAQSGGSNALVNLYWDQLHESPLNPRRHADPERLRELMASIEQHGVMQNLVVRPEPRRPLTDYEVVCGSWRLAGVALLVKEGAWRPMSPCRAASASSATSNCCTWRPSRTCSGRI
jgi:hypothetical protein